MKIIKHVHHQFDVFTGDGWLNWTRVKVKKNHMTGQVYIEFVGGSKLNKADFFNLKRMF